MTAMKEVGVWMQRNGKDMVVLSGGGGRVWGRSRKGAGWRFGGKVFKMIVGQGGVRGWLVGCWLPPQGGSLEREAPSRGRLSPEAVKPIAS